MRKDGVLLKSNIAVAFLFFMSMVAIFIFLISGGIFKKSFDRNEWIELRKNALVDCRRKAMVQDIVQNVVEKGMSKGDVVKKLGEPDRTGEKYIRYYLGMCNPVDPTSLDIILNSQGDVVEMRIVEH